MQKRSTQLQVVLALNCEAHYSWEVDYLIIFKEFFLLRFFVLAGIRFRKMCCNVWSDELLNGDFKACLLFVALILMTNTFGLAEFRSFVWVENFPDL